MKNSLNSNNMKYLAYISIVFLFVACNNEKPKKPEVQKGEYYTCPMHPEIIRDKPGDRKSVV